MSCSIYSNLLMDFHFGRVASKIRPKLEQHLETCPQCLKTYFEVKADIEASMKHEQGPTSETRHKILLRARSELRAQSLEVPHREFYVPKIFWLTASSVAIAATALIAVFYVKFLNNHHTAPHGSAALISKDLTSDPVHAPHVLQVDTASQVPESLKFL